jgi:hypothetical protein
MPNISASDYTNFVKYQAAQLAYRNGAVPRKIQTVDQAAPNVQIINAYLKTSQAAYTVTRPIASITGLNYVRAVQPERTNNPNALSTVSWASGTSGSVTSTTSSKFQQAGGLPAKNVVGTYHRIPTNAGWANGNSTQATSSALRNTQTTIPPTIL